MRRRAILLMITGALLCGCAAPNPDTASGRAVTSGQDCAACVLENPGDASPCLGICNAHEADQAGAWSGAVLMPNR